MTATHKVIYEKTADGLTRAIWIKTDEHGVHSVQEIAEARTGRRARKLLQGLPTIEDRRQQQ